MKTCTKCGLDKREDDFYARKSAPDGLRRECKSCENARSAAHRNSSHGAALRRKRMNRYNADGRASNWAKAYQASAEGKTRYRKRQKGGNIAAATQRWRASHASEYRAHTEVNNALKLGGLKRLPRALCGAKADAHHEDYSRPLDVVWLCRSHHKLRHKHLSMPLGCFLRTPPCQNAP